MTALDTACEYARTEVSQIPTIVDELRANFYAASPTSLEYRLHQLKQLLALITENKKELFEEYTRTFGGFDAKHNLERFYLIEVDIIEMINNLGSYLSRKTKYSQSFPISVMWSAEVKAHPRGVVCIIGAWNYPLQLLLRPMVGAVAAGNAIVLKPSEISDGFARLLIKLVPKYMDSKMIRVITGGVAETSKLLEQKFDFICFTGSSFVGKIVMAAAAKHLTPVCLELGGKNPVIIDDDTNLETAMKRVAFARWWFNSGQVCLCPEYVLVSKDKVDDCVTYLRKYINDFFITSTANGVLSESEHYGRIVNANHWRRLDKIRQHYISNESDKIAIGDCLPQDKNFGVSNEKQRFMAPMVLKNIDFESGEIMKSEVFGPILTIIGMDGKSSEWKAKACEMVRSKGEPLACYIFSPNNGFVNYFDERIAAGSITCNDCIYQMTLKDVPFGGCGMSGMGCYGGTHSFETFSHFKPLNRRAHGMEFLNNDRYPPGDMKNITKLLEQIKPKLGGSMMMKVAKGLMFAAVPVLMGCAYYMSIQNDEES